MNPNPNIVYPYETQQTVQIQIKFSDISSRYCLL